MGHISVLPSALPVNHLAFLVSLINSYSAPLCPSRIGIALRICGVQRCRRPTNRALDLIKVETGTKHLNRARSSPRRRTITRIRVYPADQRENGSMKGIQGCRLLSVPPPPSPATGVEVEDKDEVTYQVLALELGRDELDPARARRLVLPTRNHARDPLHLLRISTQRIYVMPSTRSPGQSPSALQGALISQAQSRQKLTVLE